MVVFIWKINNKRVLRLEQKRVHSIEYLVKYITFIQYTKQFFRTAIIRNIEYPTR